MVGVPCPKHQSVPGIPQTGMASQSVEIGVPVQNRNILANGDSRDQAVDEFAHGLPALSALPIEPGRVFVIFRAGWQNNRAGQQAPQADQLLLIPRAGQNLHAHGVADGDLVRQHRIHPAANTTLGVSQEFHPGGGVD